MFTQVTCVTLDRFAFVVTDTACVGLYKAAVENASGQTLVVVRFDCFEIVDGNAGLIADLAQANAALLAGESQLFAYTRCHLQSLVPGVGSVGPPLVLNAYNSHFFCTIACAAKRCQTIVFYSGKTSEQI